MVLVCSVHVDVINDLGLGDGVNAFDRYSDVVDAVKVSVAFVSVGRAVSLAHGVHSGKSAFSEVGVKPIAATILLLRVAVVADALRDLVAGRTVRVDHEVADAVELGVSSQ